MYHAEFIGTNRFVSLPRLKIALLVCLAAGVLFTLPSALRASVVTFAQFQEATTQPDANDFAYINNDAPATVASAELVTDPAGVPGAAVPVVFSFLSEAGLPPDLQGAQDATLSLTSSTTSGVQTGFSGTIGDQQILGDGPLLDVLTITRDTAAAEGNGSRTNLLTMTFSGTLLGELDGLTPQLSGNSNLGDTVSYTSDFLNFVGATEGNYSLAFSSWITNADGNGLEIDDTDNYFNSATAAGVGTFDANGTTVVTVPEPATTALAAGAFLPIMLRRRCRSKRAI